MSTMLFPVSGFGRIYRGLRTRASGPGGLYNIGNGFGLLTGLLAFWLQAHQQESNAWGIITSYLLGSPSAVALTLSMIVFFWSGEMYHRAWVTGGPDARFVQRGDIGSAIGAIMLGVGLLILDQPVLAATAGALHAVGKSGSAFGFTRRPPLWPAGWPDAWRSMVVLSRVPALIAASIEITRNLAGHTPLDGAEPAALLLCYLLWLRADILLIK